MRWVTLILLCLNLVCHFKTWDGVSDVWWKVYNDTNYLNAGARIKDDYICHRLDKLEGKIDNLSK